MKPESATVTKKVNIKINCKDCNVVEWSTLLANEKSVQYSDNDGEEAVPESGATGFQSFCLLCQSG